MTSDSCLSFVQSEASQPALKGHVVFFVTDPVAAGSCGSALRLIC